MPPPVAAALAPILAAAAEPVLGAAVIAVILGGLLCLAASEDEAASTPARQVLGLALGGGLAGWLAQALAVVVPSLLAFG